MLQQMLFLGAALTKLGTADVAGPCGIELGAASAAQLMGGMFLFARKAMHAKQMAWSDLCR